MYPFPINSLFNDKVDINGPLGTYLAPNTPCWLWTAGRTKAGYGVFLLNGKTTLAHRIAYECTKGPIPFNLELDHLCRVRNCVNPDHLECVTSKENMRRSPIAKFNLKNSKKKPIPNPCKGIAHGNARLTDNQVLAIRNDERSQREIALDYNIHQTLVSHIKTRKRWKHLS